MTQRHNFVHRSSTSVRFGPPARCCLSRRAVNSGRSRRAQRGCEAPRLLDFAATTLGACEPYRPCCEHFALTAVCAKLGATCLLALACVPVSRPQLAMPIVHLRTLRPRRRPPPWNRAPCCAHARRRTGVPQRLRRAHLRPCHLLASAHLSPRRAGRLHRKPGAACATACHGPLQIADATGERAGAALSAAAELWVLSAAVGVRVAAEAACHAADPADAVGLGLAAAADPHAALAPDKLHACRG